MREARVTVGGLGGMAESSTMTVAPLLANGTVEILHPEQMRGDLRVPPVMRYNSRFER